MLDSGVSDNEMSKRDVPSFIEARPPLILNPFMRPKPLKGTNLLKLFEEDSDCEEPELVQVYLRLKPCDNPSTLYEVRSDRYLVTSLDTTTAGHGRRTQHNVSKMYTFSHIFGPETNQKEIFENVVKDNLKKLPEGNSFTLLTYGASGSGKTFTLMGTVASPGLVPRSLEYVFKIVDAAQMPVYKPSESGVNKLSYSQQEYELQWMKSLQVSAPLKDKYRRMSMQLRNDLAASHLDLSNRSRHYVWVSFIEIYNEGIYDLLAPGERRNAQRLAIREDSSGNVYVKGATQAFVRSGEEAYDVMVAGKHNLQVAATGVHAQSSRSHCIFTITMLTEGENGVSVSHVRLCDLAGCERAARTRNTGTRMCESRAINSSLHVLERCLRALRRRQPTNAPPRRAIIPYRESKLTRLLGSGLSGSRGEAVSMVVTLNPSPDYANETRHVLQLAAVAKDIQINNTLSEYPSSLEITQDTTIEFSAEVMKLRAENERLHFELVQAQARNREMLSCMEQQQAAGADAVRALVDEARDITRTYYEEQLQALQNEMDEMVQEYESKLNAIEVSKSERPSTCTDTKINQLMTEIAILEEKLTAEKMAREVVEEEVQHLRACIEERDGKADEFIPTEDVTLTDSESEEEDPCNESLEPTFKREDINKSRLLRQSAIQSEEFDSENSVLDKTNDTLKDDTHDGAYEASEDISDNSLDNTDSKICTVKKANIHNTYYGEEIKKEITSDVNTKLSRETYCVTDYSENISSQLKSEENQTSFQNKINKSDENDEVLKLDNKIVIDKQPNSFVNKIISSIKKSTDSNNSLAQFERLELAAKACDDEVNTTEIFTNINILKEKRTFFGDGTKSPAIKERKIYFDNLNVEEPKRILDEVKHIDDYRSPSIVKDEVMQDFTPSMIKKLLGESKKQGNMGQKAKLCSNAHGSIDPFEFDSPQVLPKTDTVEIIEKSVANIVISDEFESEELITYDKKSIVEKVLKRCSDENMKITLRIQHEDLGRSVAKDTEIKTNDIETNDQLVVKQQSPFKNEISTKNEHNFKFDDDKVTESLHFKDKIKIEITKDFTTSNISDDVSNKPVIIQEEETALVNEDLIKQNSEDSNTTNVDNTIEQFDNIYKDVTVPNPTDFELLVSQENQESSIEHNNNNDDETDDVKYNLRNKRTEKLQPSTKKEVKDKPKRMNLRLRRRQNLSEEDDSGKDIKFKDILNLQSEFSDVTLDVPATAKPVKDIPSPEKVDEENLLPSLSGIQSCPSKSVTRSRRKLFTPLPEPLDESAGDSNERVCVPRPSYHRPRARRKL